MRLSAAAIAVLALVLLAGVVSAQRFNGKNPKPRSMEFDVKPHALTIDAKAKPGTQQSALKFEFTTNGFPRSRVSYFYRSSDTRKGFTFRTGVMRLIEFADNSTAAINGYDSADTIIKTLKLTGATSAWSNIAQSAAITNADGSSAKEYSTFFTGSGAFVNTKVTLKLSIADSTFEWKNKTVAPNNVKMDIVVDNWPWSTIANTKLGIVMAVQTKNNVKPPASVSTADQTGSIAEAGVDVGDGSGRFGWVKKCLKNYTAPNAQEANIVASALIAADPKIVETTNISDDDDSDKAGESMQHIVFTIDDTTKPSSIYWDPSTAVNSDSLDNSPATMTSASMVLSAVLAIALVFMF